MFPYKINRAIDKAINLAKTNPSKFRLASIGLDKKGNIVSFGQNSSKSHPMMPKIAERKGHKEQIFLHAECACLIRARKQVHYLIVVRILKSGELGLARPCPLCQEAIAVAKVRNIVYSNQYGNFTWERRKC